MIYRYFFFLSLTTLLLSCAEPQSSPLKVVDDNKTKNYVVLDETMSPLIKRFNNVNDSLKLVFIVGPT